MIRQAAFCGWPVVWEPGDDGVVERPVAQRGLCQIHGVYFPGHHLPRAARGEKSSSVLLLQYAWTGLDVINICKSLYFCLNSGERGLNYLFFPVG